jgi:hypothetical protein
MLGVIRGCVCSRVDIHGRENLDPRELVFNNALTLF